MTERPDIEGLEVMARRVLPVLGGDKVISKVIALCDYTLGLEAEVRRLNTGWKGANERVLEVGLQAKETERRLKEENADRIEGKNATLGSLRQYADGLVKREQAALERVKELDAKIEQQRLDALPGAYVGGLDD